MSKQRSQKGKTDAYSASEESSLATPLQEGTDPESLLFPEFSDQDINSERWDNTSAKDKSTLNIIKVVYDDPHQIHLPSGLTVNQWKRCNEVFDVNFVVYSTLTEYPDFLTPNQHLLNIEFYRNFISTIENLLYISSTKPFPTEYGNPGYYTLEQLRPWRPWHHIYSQCKIVKGEHSAVYNSAGKYVVRLFWLGTWRKVYVDDKLPLDDDNKLLLPTLYKQKEVFPMENNTTVAAKRVKSKPKTAASSVKKDTVDIWPMILCKALLKLASLTRSKISKYNDFDIVNCLTGWIPQKLHTKDISNNDLWDVFTAYVDRFEWPDNKDGSTKKTGSTKKSKETPKKGVKETIPAGIENMKDGHRFVILSCNNSVFQGSQTFYSYVSQVRDIPINPTPPRPELEFWKTFRYEKWATAQGIIPPDIKKLQIKSLKVVDSFKRFNRLIEESQLNQFEEMEVIDKKSEKSSKSSKKVTKEVKSLEPDPSMWLDLNDVQETLLYVTIYYQPRGFKSKIKISDINFIQKSTDFKQIIYPYIPKQIGNDPIYAFLDSIDYKLLLLNLAQEGDKTALCIPEQEEEEEIISESLAESIDICEEIVLAKTKQESRCSSLDDTAKRKSIYGQKSQPVSLVIEDYDWKSNIISQNTMSINTYGTKSLLIGLNPGRKSYRIWISSSSSYVLQVFSDTPITIGCREEYLMACGQESQMLTNLCYELGSGFGQLVQSLGLPEHSINLRSFYQCYKPYRQLSKKQLALIHRVFFEELCTIIVEKTTVPNALDVVKLLFLQLKTYEYINPYVETPHLYPENFPREDQVEYAKSMQRAAVKIQAFFKKVYIRLILKKLQDYKLYAEILESLKKIYQEVFAADKRIANCSILMRRFFERAEIRPIKHLFEIYNDIDTVLDLHIFNAYTGTNEQSWVPLCRYEFNVWSEEPIPIKVDLFSNLKNYTVRVFNNDTLEELKRSMNNMLVHKYSKNQNGYTVLCYGWSDYITRITYKLIIAHKKSSFGEIVQIPNTLLITQSLKDHYMPNYKNIICRYIIKIYSSVYLTANLTTSFDKVNISLKLLDKKGNVIKETLGTRSAILPILSLNFNEIDTESVMGLIDDIFTNESKMESVSNAYSDITYSKLYKKSTVDSFDTRSIRSSSIKSVSNYMESELFGKHPKRKSSQEKTGDERCLGNHSYSGTSDAKIQLNKKSHKSLTSRTSDSAPKGRTNSKPINQSKFTDAVCTEYILEAKVVGDSWPLTADEYSRVQKLREKNYLNLFKELKQMSSRKLLKKAFVPIEEPYWILDLLYISENEIEFVQDRSQIEQKKQIKSLWFQDIDRYRRAMELRAAYLEDYLIDRNIDIDKTKRSNDPKDFVTKIIKDEPLDQYFMETSEPIDEECCKIKREDDYVINEGILDHKIKIAKADQQGATEELESRLIEQKEDFELLNKWFEEIKNDSQEMLDDVLALKKRYLDKLNQNISKEKGGKKGKGKKK
ncbi:androglobin-like [Anthonomus grandis grandis]|uniref:androglobin-like n=1 Tax=Anthonomus grandis grandis TaxID=2921223 RepID=UPI002166776B|nr:androglobin-like [Anthonomus grandis grandis]